MTTTAQARVGSNSSKKLAPFIAHLTNIQKLTQRAEMALQGHHLRVHKALVQVYAMGLQLIEGEVLELFIAAQRGKISARQAQNEFHDLVTLAFEKAREDSRSKYRKVLKFALIEDWSEDDLAEELKADTFENLYNRALNAGRKKGDERREDTLVELLKEAKTVLAKTSLGKVSGLSSDEAAPHTVDGYASAILRVNGDAADIVGFVSAGPKDHFERQLVDLVPAISARGPVQLSKKNLYEFFVICDVFTRCLSKRSEIRDLLEAHHSMQQEFRLDADTDPKDTSRILRSRLDDRKRTQKVTVAEVTAQKQVLWLTKQEGESATRVECGTTLPSMIWMEAELQLAVFKQRATELQLDSLDVENFVKAFPRQIDWEDEHTSVGSILSGSDDPPTRFAFSANTSGRTGFRILKQGAEPVLQFRITKGVIGGLTKWRADFKATLTKNSKKEFATRLNFIVAGGSLWLSFANNPMERRLLAKHPKTAAGPLDLPSTWLVESRLVDRFIALANDYGLEFDAQLLAIGVAPFALELSCVLPTGPFKLTIPMSVGLAGGLVEITDSHMGLAALPSPRTSSGAN